MDMTVGMESVCTKHYPFVFKWPNNRLVRTPGAMQPSERIIIAPALAQSERWAESMSKNITIFVMIVISALMTSGCPNFERASYPEKWQQLQPIVSIKSIAGKYKNCGTSGYNLDYDKPTNELWYFLTKQANKPNKEAIVSIIPVDESQLSIDLIENDKHQKHFILTLDEDFKLDSGSIVLLSQFGASYDGFGAGVGTSSFVIHQRIDGDLVGELKGSAVGLLLYVLPAIGFGRSWNSWIKVEPFNGLQGAAEERGP